MLAFFALGLLLLLVLVAASRWYVDSKPQEIIRVLMWGLLTLGMGIVVWLALSGRLIAALAALPAVLLWLARIFTGLRYARIFDRMMGGANRQHQNRSSNPSTNMSRVDALKVLGLHEGVSAQEIKTAHRRLISHLHPDVGGSDYLAQQINQAKDVLLG